MTFNTAPINAIYAAPQKLSCTPLFRAGYGLVLAINKEKIIVKIKNMLDRIFTHPYWTAIGAIGTIAAFLITLVVTLAHWNAKIESGISSSKDSGKIMASENEKNNTNELKSHRLRG